MRRLRLSIFLTLAAGILTSACGIGVSSCGFSVGVEPDTSSAASRARDATTADPTAPAARPRIVALGDSLTIGLGLVESQSYPSLLQKRLDENGYGFEVVNAGVSGETSAGGLRRLDWALEGDVRILILALGANDGLRGLPVDEMKQNLSTIIERAKERNIVVILAGMEAPPNYGPEYVQAYRRAFPDVAQQGACPADSVPARQGGRASDAQSGRRHPSERSGRGLVADTIWPVLRSVIDQMGSAS